MSWDYPLPFPHRRYWSASEFVFLRNFLFESLPSWQEKDFLRKHLTWLKYIGVGKNIQAAIEKIEIN